MPLTPGTRIGHYTITAQIGAGGMGEVYRATDTTLGRQVALKVLPDAVSHDADRLARLVREAKALATLNHPNIAQVYGLEHGAVVMELVEGPTLAEVIAHDGPSPGGLPLDQVLGVASQIAEALGAAHDAGVIHRDLKPANIKVRADGVVKVLDFGLAKPFVRDGAAADATHSPTITTPAMTERGVILGTAAYMAPEQARGLEVDRRADIWSLGAVIYEMLTGRRAFQGQDVADTLAAVLRAEPEWSALPGATPAGLRRLLHRSLTKDRRDRLSDMAMVRLDLRDAGLELTSAPAHAAATAAPTAGLQRRIPLMAGAIALTALGIFAGWMARPAPGVNGDLTARFPLAIPEAALTPADPVNGIAISPDGRTLVIGMNRRLYIRELGRMVTRPLPGTERGGDAFARAPFFSDDGRAVAFWQERQLRRMALPGGPITTMLDDVAAMSGGSWSGDEILFGAPGGIWRVSSMGGAAERVVDLGAGALAVYPQAIPGGRILFTLRMADAGPEESGQIVILARSTGQRQVIVEAGNNAKYSPSGHVIYYADGQLLAQPFDAASGTVRGAAFPIGEQAGPNNPAAVSANGTLAYVVPPPRVTATRLVQRTRTGGVVSATELDGVAWFPRFSPDGTRLAYGLSPDARLGTASDIWVLNLLRGSRTRVTFEGDNRHFPVWTPDGTRLTFSSGIGLDNRVVLVQADGGGTPQTLVQGGRRFPTSWSPDGKVLALYGGGGQLSPSRDILLLGRSDGTQTPQTFVSTPFEERGAIFSPDGRWLAYVSNKSGVNDVFVRPFPGPGEEITVSVAGGQEPVWAPSGRELYYRHAGKMLAVSVAPSSNGLSIGMPVELFEDRYRVDTTGAQGGVANYDISRDGQRFVVVENARAADAGSLEARIHIVLNWFAELNTRQAD